MIDRSTPVLQPRLKKPTPTDRPPPSIETRSNNVLSNMIRQQGILRYFPPRDNIQRRQQEKEDSGNK